jgi:hypothetical protein
MTGSAEAPEMIPSKAARATIGYSASLVKTSLPVVTVGPIDAVVDPVRTRLPPAKIAKGKSMRTKAQVQHMVKVLLRLDAAPIRRRPTRSPSPCAMDTPAVLPSPAGECAPSAGHDRRALRCDNETKALTANRAVCATAHPIASSWLAFSGLWRRQQRHGRKVTSVAPRVTGKDSAAHHCRLSPNEEIR